MHGCLEALLLEHLEHSGPRSLVLLGPRFCHPSALQHLPLPRMDLENGLFPTRHELEQIYHSLNVRFDPFSWHRLTPEWQAAYLEFMCGMNRSNDLDDAASVASSNIDDINPELDHGPWYSDSDEDLEDQSSVAATDSPRSKVQGPCLPADRSPDQLDVEEGSALPMASHVSAQSEAMRSEGDEASSDVDKAEEGTAQETASEAMFSKGDEVASDVAKAWEGSAHGTATHSGEAGAAGTSDKVDEIGDGPHNDRVRES